MKFANGVNGLVVKFIRLDYDDVEQTDMLVMERLYPLDFRAYEVERRELWLGVFEDKLRALHKAGFVHRDINRPSGLTGRQYDNIFLPENGIRLIDVGISALKSQVGENLFNRDQNIGIAELNEFKEFFLNR